MNTMTESVDPRILELFEFRPRKGDLKKLEIIEAAISCLHEEGLENTTFEAIAVRIGTRRAHVAYHFSDKSLIFMNAVKYILGTYQGVIIDRMRGINDGQKMLTAYIESAFDWALDHPEQVSVMLLLYYLCQLDQDFIELHDRVRAGGVERLNYIIGEKCLPGLKANEVNLIAKTIQDMISGAMIDSKTTSSTNLKKAKSRVLKSAKLLVNAAQDAQ